MDIRFALATLCFIIANAMDVAFSYLLFQMKCFGEVNPVANFFYNQYGFMAMVQYKVMVVLAVIIIICAVYRKNKQLGVWTMCVGTAIVTGIVLYSGILLAYIELR